MTGASVTNTAKMFGASGSTDLQVMITKLRPGRKPKLSDMNRRNLTQIVGKNHKIIGPNTTAVHNDNPENSVFTKTFHHELHKT